MYILTSIAYYHANLLSQREAIESWKEYGKCFSLNGSVELSKLKSGTYEGITFIETHKTVEHYVGKPLVNINSFFDFGIENKEDILIVNSDIILKDLPELKKDGVTLFSRYDYDNDMSSSIMFPHGWDVFHIPYRFLKIFPPMVYALGQSFWDVAVPMICLRNNIPLYYPTGRFAFHKKHETQYSIEEWFKTGEYFKLDFRFDKSLSVDQIVTVVMGEIKSQFRR